MTKVITYGTFDLLHYGHIRLLERAKVLGDYLIVGVTADDFDKLRGKINVQQSLMERLEAVRATGIADEIIIEEYEGQKIDDIKRYGIDIFTVGSDWVGKFDYLNEYCKVIYLERTQGISSSNIRAQRHEVKLGLVGESGVLGKIEKECRFVNGLSVTAVYAEHYYVLPQTLQKLYRWEQSYPEFLDSVEAVYIASHPTRHYRDIKMALERGKHVICESPVVLDPVQFDELSELAVKKGCILGDAIKTAYSTAYSRLLLLVKSGRIGKVVSVDTTCTSLSDIYHIPEEKRKLIWNSICAWGPAALLPVFQLLGTQYSRKHIISSFADKECNLDSFTKIDFLYPDAVASVKVGKGIKSEGEMIISGTKGYIYVPAPWWKTDYFEIRYENPADNKRYFYQLDGEGIRYEMVSFVKSIETQKSMSYIDPDITKAISGVIYDFEKRVDMDII